MQIPKAFTPNETVAINLAHLRQQRGLTQEQAGELVAPYLGAALSRASWSAIEKSPNPKARSREFSADEIIAFAQAFDVHPLELLLPPISVVRRTADSPPFVARVKTPNGELELVEFFEIILGRGRLSRLAEELADRIATLPGPTRKRFSSDTLAGLTTQGQDRRRARIERQLREALSKAAKLAEQLETEEGQQ